MTGLFAFVESDLNKHEPKKCPDCALVFLVICPAFKRLFGVPPNVGSSAGYVPFFV
jgi:hypothetical protein